MPAETVAAAPSGLAWSVADSSRLYGLEAWGDPYFTVSSRGHVIVQPRG